MTNVDNFQEGEKIQATATGAASAISLDHYGDNAYLTKPEMCRAFSCSERTLQRMIERFELPPPMTLGGRKVWIAGKIRAWLADAANRKEAEAVKEARRLQVFDN